MRRFCILALFVVFTFTGVATVGADPIDGSIVITGVRADNDDGFAFTLLESIDPGVAIGFTDRRYIGGGLGTGEGPLGGFWDGRESIMTWTNTTGASIQAGFTVIVNDNGAAAETSSIGSVSRTGGDLSLAVGGESLYAFTGSFQTDVQNNIYLDGDLLFGLQWAGMNRHGTNQANPTGAFGIVEFAEDNGSYSGPRNAEDEFSNYASLVSDSSNWTGTNSANAPTAILNGSGFVAVAEPGTVGLMFFGLIGFVFLRKRRKDKQKIE